MTKSKKILSVVLAIAMVLSFCAISAFAAPPTATVTVSADNATVAAGDTVTITVTANSTEDFYAGPMSIPVEYDSTLFTLGTVTTNEVFGAGVTQVTVVRNTEGKVRVGYGVKTSGNPVAPNLKNANLVLFSFTLVAKDAAGTSDIAIADDQKTTTHTTGKFYMGSFDSSDAKNGTLTQMGQTLNRVNTTVTVGSAGEVALILTQTGEDNGAVIDRNKCTSSGDYAGAVYGIDTINGESIADYVTTEVGSIEVVENDEGFESTGATILLKDAEGEVVETYVFIYFGDVNGDGSVDTADASDIEEHNAWTRVLDDDSAQLYAGDVNFDGATDTADASDIEEYNAWTLEQPAQSEIAAEILNAY